MELSDEVDMETVKFLIGKKENIKCIPSGADLDVVKYLYENGVEKVCFGMNTKLDVAEYLYPDKNISLTFEIYMLNGKVLKYMDDVKKKLDSQSPQSPSLRGITNKMDKFIQDRENGKFKICGIDIHRMAQFNNLEALKYVFEEYGPQPESSICKICLSEAAYNGHIDIVKWLIEEKKVGVRSSEWAYSSMSFKTRTPLSWAKRGSYEGLPGCQEVVDYIRNEHKKNPTFLEKTREWFSKIFKL